MKKYINAFLLLLITILIFSGCSNNKQDEKIKENETNIIDNVNKENSEINNPTTEKTDDKIIEEDLSERVYIKCKVKLTLNDYMTLEVLNKKGLELPDELDVKYINSTKDDYSIDETIYLETNGIIREGYSNPIGKIYAIHKNYFDEETQIKYNGKIYEKEDISKETMDWINLSPLEKLTSNYKPSELDNLDNIIEKWGTILSVKDVTNKSLKIVCNQSGGTFDSLHTGNFFVVQQPGDDGNWYSVPPIKNTQSFEPGKLIITPSGETIFEVNWADIVGILDKGFYRIKKEIINYRGPNDYDKELAYAYFEIE